ncbi:hypothetical protein GCM10010293_07570 [Streptomyces griseoflavus]|nr:hypothetical protein GCM10010293_07570 [Streptomyces griseoflavus]
MWVDRARQPTLVALFGRGPVGASPGTADTRDEPTRVRAFAHSSGCSPFGDGRARVRAPSPNRRAANSVLSGVRPSHRPVETAR